MTVQEFADQFDVLYNSITSNQAPGLDAYEKSVFLTKAQDEIVKAYFSPKLNKSQEGFDDSEKRQIDFSTLISVITYTPKASIEEQSIEGTEDSEDSSDNKNSNKVSTDLSSKGLFDTRGGTANLMLQTDILMIINETVNVTRNNREIPLVVIPLKYEDYARLMSKPYKRPLQYQAWRLINKDKTADLIVGSNDNIESYVIRYIRKPKPIVLENLSELSVNGESNISECELDENLHQEILQRAVELASAVYKGDLTTQLALGQTSQTNLGIVTSK